MVLVDPTGERPYRANLSGQVLWTTGGHRNHYLRVDLPGIAGSRWRFTATARRILWEQAPYYGIGNHTPLTHDPKSTYYWWTVSRWSLRAMLRCQIVGDWEAFADYRIRHEGITVQPDTLLDAERPEGWEGGRYATAALGVLIDTRQNEINPTQGVAADLSLRVSAPWVGSQWTSAGVTAGFRSWLSLGQRVVWANHLLVDSRWGNEPFFNQAYVGGLGRGVIGGRWILRGLPEERYRGDGLALTQQELRITVLQHSVRKRSTWSWMVVPFADLARTWSWAHDDPRLGLHPTGGAGLRLNLNDLIVLRADVGVGPEEYAEPPERRPSVQVYLLSEHPF